MSLSDNENGHHVDFQKIGLPHLAPTPPIMTPPTPALKNFESMLTPGRRNLRTWLGKTFRVVISDGRILVGFFNCTDKDANLVLSLCTEYVEEGKDARILGNVMIPGKHIVSISVDMPNEEQQQQAQH